MLTCGLQHRPLEHLSLAVGYARGRSLGLPTLTDHYAHRRMRSKSISIFAKKSGRPAETVSREAPGSICFCRLDLGVGEIGRAHV